MQTALREDALTSTTDGIEVRIGLPWIRSLPLACLREPGLSIDGEAVASIRLRLGDRSVAPADLIHESGWWFAQDRVVLVADTPLESGQHDVIVTFSLLIPYLMAGPGGGALELPMRLAGRLELDHAPIPSVSLDVVGAPA